MATLQKLVRIELVEEFHAALLEVLMTLGKAPSEVSVAKGFLGDMHQLSGRRSFEYKVLDHRYRQERDAAPQSHVCFNGPRCRSRSRSARVDAEFLRDVLYQVGVRVGLINQLMDTAHPVLVHQATYSNVASSTACPSRALHGEPLSALRHFASIRRHHSSTSLLHLMRDPLHVLVRQRLRKRHLQEGSKRPTAVDPHRRSSSSFDKPPGKSKHRSRDDHTADC